MQEQMYAFVDAAYGGEVGDGGHAFSFGGQVVLYNGGAIAWSSNKQSITALSSTEAELIQCSTAARLMAYIIPLAQNMGVNLVLPVRMFEDNMSTITIAHNAVSGTRTKHIHVRHHYIREMIRSGSLSLTHCPTAEMLADMLTKPLARDSLTRLRDTSMGVTPFLINVPWIKPTSTIVDE